MFKFVSFFALLAVAAAAPGLIAQTHSIVQPAYVDHSASSAITHQSNVNLVRKVPVSPVVTYAAAPVVHSVHAAPLIKTVVPAVHTVHAAPVVHTVHAVPQYHPVVAASPVVYSAFHHK
ncbi:uncharacterized protein LOC117588954 isoform X1 [Drosophila guanche]|uniref:Pupal cuticle protein G1A n=1 Tax=Drosophila guanche TaxID=7266 RepID=A0A3B0KMK2_DROGU|nr:uncharacterized protein LOC117588954 isoform X1 [Drosophila guanche]SPP87056.1 Hypothetical predicted protein [Drosophila guanche]